MPEKTIKGEEKSNRLILFRDVLNKLAYSTAPMGVTEIARELSRNKVYIHRALSSLEMIGWVCQDRISQKYKISNDLVTLGLLLSSRSPLPKITLPFLYELSYITNETTALSVRIGFERLFLQHIPAKHDNSQSVVLGQRYPLWLGATGKAIAAFLDDRELNELLAIMERERTTIKKDLTLTTEQWRNQLREIKERGYAISLGEYSPDICVLAAPIFDQKQTVVGSIIVRGKAPSFDITTAEKYSTVILKMASDISAAVQESA